MPIKMQREQIDHARRHGLDDLRSLDSDIPFIKVIDIMIAKGISEEVAIEILEAANFEDIAFLGKQDLPSEAFRIRASEVMREELRKAMTKEFRRQVMNGGY